MSARKDRDVDFSFYQAADGDQFDIGFRIRGYQFRFINPRKQERSQDRPWKMLTESDLPPAFVQELKSRRPGFFGSDGLHRRMGENILAFSTDEAYNAVKKLLQERNREDMERIVGRKQHGGSLTTEGAFEDAEDYAQQFKK